jgi:hypothetical protein
VYKYSILIDFYLANYQKILGFIICKKRMTVVVVVSITKNRLINCI